MVIELGRTEVMQESKGRKEKIKRRKVSSMHQGLALFSNPKNVLIFEY